jgi:hypothetical protein
MTDSEFDSFVATCNAELEEKQAALEQQFGLGRYARWAYDGTTGLLTFADDRGVTVVRAETTQIGSYSQNTQTWKWAWANASIPDAQRVKSLRLKGLYDLTGIDVFRQESFVADEQMPWEIAAMSVHQLGALGCYRGPAKHLHVFFALDNVTAAGSAT